MRKIREFYRNLSLTTQIILTIIMVFISFFILQLFLNSVFFRNYYIEREIETFEAALTNLNETLSSRDENDYFDHLYTFSQQYSVPILLIEDDYTLTLSSTADYTVSLFDPDTNETYIIYIFDNDYTFEIGEVVTTKISQLNDTYYTFSYLQTEQELIYDQPCNPCLSITGTITDINKPQSVNYLFKTYPNISSELHRLQTLDLSSYQTDSGYIYTSLQSDNTIVLIQEIDDHYLLTLFKVQNIDGIINTVSSYQNYVYLTAIAIIILWSFRIGKIISTPIKKIDTIGRKIAHLNFDVQAKEYQNKEAASLSNSINLIAKNLSNTIDTINKKNQELTTLYNDQTKQANLRKQLVSSISHELKTPLMIMQVTIQGILDGVIKEEEQNNELKNLLDDINKSSLMIQDMLQIYRLEDKEMNLDYATFDLGKTTTSILADFHTFIKKYNLTLQTQINDNIMIDADEKLITRALSNFITNAIKYTPNGQTIHITVTKDDQFAYFNILNEGAHIDTEQLKNIWLPFYRIDSDFDKDFSSKGSGIGLYLVGEILKAHQFIYTIENKKNGVEAIIKIPI